MIKIQFTKIVSYVISSRAILKEKKSINFSIKEMYKKINLSINEIWN